MADDLMRYDLMAQQALRGVVRQALERIAKSGLPGDHHFYVTFDIKAPGVRVSERLHAQYDAEMTIVLQHQFWGLEVGEDRFTVELSFNNIPEKLTIPFEAVRGFFDPSVQFGLQFETAEGAAATAGGDAVAAANEDESEAKETAQDNNEGDGPGLGSAAPAASAAGGDKAGAEVVELDAFRKK